MNWQVVKDLVAYGREQEKIHNKKFPFYTDYKRRSVKR